MILIGDPCIPYENIVKIKSQEDIKDTEPNSTVIYNFDKDILQYASQNSIQSAVVVDTVLEAIYAHNLGAKYIIVATDEMAIAVQDLADHYMFDSKILVIINSADEIEEIAIKHIDGVIYQNLLGE